MEESPQGTVVPDENGKVGRRWIHCGLGGHSNGFAFFPMQ